MVKRLALLLGALLLLAGVIVGFMPQEASGVSCGSAFVASYQGVIHDECGSKLSTVRTFVWPLVGVGAAGLYLGASAAYVERATARRRAAARLAR